MMNERKTAEGDLSERKRNAVSAKTNGAVIKPRDMVRIRGGMDRTMLIIAILLLCYGSIMVFSSSYAYALSSRGDSYYFIKRQVAWASVGLVAMFFVAHLDYKFFYRFTWHYYAVVCVLLVLVLFMGNRAGDAQRWITVPGTSVGIQPSEFMKLALVLALAKYLSLNEEKAFNSRKKWYPVKYGLLFPLCIVLLACGLVALERHFSGTTILFLIGVVLIFVAGGSIAWIGGSGLVFAAGLVMAISFVPYARQRVDIFLHPENYSSQGEVWQTLQGLNAVGSGGFFGVGLGHSMQKHMFVSQPQNDFIFSIICEELGFIGALTVIALFVAFVWRGLVIASRAPDTFSRLVVVGIVSKVAVQAILNMMVVTSMVPNTGISLPFFSYGGSSLVILLVEVGIVLSVSRYSYQEK